MKQWITENKANIKTTLTVAWPAVMESFFVALVGIVDSFMVSRLGTYAVAAVGLTTQPKFLGLALFTAVNVALSSITARRKGQNDRDGANRTLLFVLWYVLLLGVIVSVICVTFADTFIRLAGSQEDTHEAAVAYFRIIMGGMMFTIISLAINAAQRGSGNTKIALRTNLTSNLVNVVFNFLLIEGHFGFPALGIEGAAIATVIGTAVSCGMSIASVFRKDSFVNITYMIANKLKATMADVKVLIKLASSVFAEHILLRIGFMSVAVMAANLGTQEYAAHQIGMNVMSLSFSFGDGMQVAAVTLIGQCLGRKEPEMAKKYGTICQRIGNVISIVLSILYLVGGETFFRLYFPQDEYAVSIGLQIMKVMVIIVLMQVAQVIYMGCLRGAGDVKFTMIASTISVTLIRPTVSYLCAYVLQMGVIGIWLGIVGDQVVRLILTNWRFRSGKWTKIEV
ncbi:MAG: MATE family efflux transporter [Lachnospiraceae bacterium]|nr:MATE family efflux transporter [Lachnospiraceae bacterium]